MLLLWPFSPGPRAGFKERIPLWYLYTAKGLFHSSRACQNHAQPPLCFLLSKMRARRNFPRCACDGPLPVVFWLHGGAYIRGDKADVEGYCVQVAAQGYHVLNVNYPPCARSKLSGRGACRGRCLFFCRRPGGHPGAGPFPRLFCGRFRRRADVRAVRNGANRYAICAGCPNPADRPRESIRGVGLSAVFTTWRHMPGILIHTPVSYVVKRIFWGVIGDAEWRHGPELEEASVLRHIPPCGFPPVFLTDGNIGTFTEQEWLMPTRSAPAVLLSKTPFTRVP